MADADDSKPETVKSAENRRKRPPVTIDLEAEAVAAPRGEAPSADSDDPEVTTPPAGNPEGPATASVDAEPAADPEADPAPAIERRRAGAAPYLPILAAAVLGGIVGGLITGFIVSPQTDTVGEASIDSRFQALGSRVDRIEAAQQQAPAPAAAAPQDDSRLAALEQEIAALKSAPPQTAIDGAEERPTADLAPLEARLAALENRPAESTAAPVDLGPLEQRLSSLQSRLDQFEANPPSDPRTETAARAIALTSLRQAAAAGGAFQDELGAYAALGGEAAALQPLASAGAPSLASLQAEFPAIAARIRAVAAKADPNAGFLDKLAASAGALVQVKPAGPVEGSSATAVLSRMEAAVARGDLSAALVEAEGLSASEKAELAAWSDGASRRVAVDAAIAALPPAGAANGQAE